jgi:hypothetical protein
MRIAVAALTDTIGGRRLAVEVIGRINLILAVRKEEVHVSRPSASLRSSQRRRTRRLRAAEPSRPLH